MEWRKEERRVGKQKVRKNDKVGKKAEKYNRKKKEK